MPAARTTLPSPSKEPAHRSDDQKRALHALDRVKAAASGDAEVAGCYRSYARALPAVILANGLGQALAMELAFSSRVGNVGNGHTLLFAHVSDWFEKGWANSPYKHEGNAAADDRLIRAIAQKSQQEYDRAQAEAMAYLKWLKKFAEALIPPGGED